MEKNNRRMHMRGKILLLCLGSTLGALIFQTVLFQRVSGTMIYNQAKAENYSRLQNMQNEIYTFIKNIESGLIDIYNEKEFMQELKGHRDIQALRADYYRLAYRKAMEQFETTDGVVAFYIYNSEHQIVSTYRRAVTPKHNYPKDLYEDGEMANVEKIREYVASDDKRMFISGYYNPYRETNIVHFVLKIYDNVNTGGKIGYVICDIDSKTLTRIMEKYSTYQEGCMWLQPSGDRYIALVGNPEEENQEYWEQVSEKIAEDKLEEWTVPLSEKRVMFQVPQEKYNLGAYFVMPQYILEQNQKALVQNTIIVAVVMCIVLSLVTVFVTSTLTKPLEELSGTIAGIREGDTQKRVAYLKDDEIGKLGREFNGMLDEIERLIGHEYETKLLLNKAEYKALQAQINPHFLYNTLDTMSSIASIQNCGVVSNLCQSLSNIFRYSLDIGHPYSNVAKEIVHLKNYIYVMNVRMREEISYHFDIADDMLQNSIPRISVQPLVENAIKHGLKNKRGEKTVWVKVFGEGENLIVSVSDNGVGMDAEDINRRLKDNLWEQVESGSSIGLFNINARMKMLYGDAFGITVESDGRSGTRVILKVPCISMEGVETWQR